MQFPKDDPQALHKPPADNPFKRRGPGASHAAQLGTALELQSANHPNERLREAESDEHPQTFPRWNIASALPVLNTGSSVLTSGSPPCPGPSTAGPSTAPHVSGGTPARARAGETTQGGGACEMPAKPLPAMVPGLVLRYSITTDQASRQHVTHRLQRYRQLHDELRQQGRSKPDLIASAQLRCARQQPYLGHPPGIRPGDVFEGRGELAALCIHSLTAAGIDWLGAHPAFAVCLSGGYADDEDTGAQIWYTGMGGQHKQEQVLPQLLGKGNLALKMSMDLQTPVRVCRAASARERNGTVFRMYSYAGLYIVKEMKRVKSIDGPVVYKFKLVAVAGHAVQSAPVKFNHFGLNHSKKRRRKADLRGLLRKRAR